MISRGARALALALGLGFLTLAGIFAWLDGPRPEVLGALAGGCGLSLLVLAIASAPLNRKQEPGDPHE